MFFKMTPMSKAFLFRDNGDSRVKGKTSRASKLTIFLIVMVCLAIVIACFGPYLADLLWEWGQRDVKIPSDYPSGGGNTGDGGNNYAGWAAIAGANGGGGWAGGGW